jgi:hypothetical protein
VYDSHVCRCILLRFIIIVHLLFSGFELTRWRSSHAEIKWNSFGMQLPNGLSSHVRFDRESC